MKLKSRHNPVYLTYVVIYIKNTQHKQISEEKEVKNEAISEAILAGAARHESVREGCVHSHTCILCPVGNGCKRHCTTFAHLLDRFGDRSKSNHEVSWFAIYADDRLYFRGYDRLHCGACTGWQDIAVRK